MKTSLKAIGFVFLAMLSGIQSWSIHLILRPLSSNHSGARSSDSEAYHRIIQIVQNGFVPRDKSYIDALKGIKELYWNSYLTKAIYIAPDWFIGLNDQIGQVSRYFDNDPVMRSILVQMPRPQKWITHPDKSLNLVLVKLADFLKGRTPIKRYFGPVQGDDYYFFSNVVHNAVGDAQEVFLPTDPTEGLIPTAPIAPFALNTMHPECNVFLGPLGSKLLTGLIFKSEKGMPVLKKSANSGSFFDQYKLAGIGLPTEDSGSFRLPCLYLSDPKISNWIGNTLISDALEALGQVVSGTGTNHTTTTATTIAISNTNTINNIKKQTDAEYESEMSEKLGLELKGGDGYPISSFWLVTTQGRQVGPVVDRSVIRDWSNPEQNVTYKQMSISKVYHLPDGLVLAYLKTPLLDVKFNLFDPNRHPESIDMDNYNHALNIKEYLKRKYSRYYNYAAQVPTIKENVDRMENNFNLIINTMKIGSKLLEDSKAHRAKSGSKAADPLLRYWNEEIGKIKMPDISFHGFISYKDDLERLNFTPTSIHKADKILTDYQNHLNAISNMIITEALGTAPAPVRVFN